MGKETVHEQEKAHEEHKDAHDTHQEVHQKPKNLDAQGKQAIKQTAHDDFHTADAHAKDAHANDPHAKDAHGEEEHHAPLGPADKALARAMQRHSGLPLDKCERIVGKLVHWSHAYSHAVHDYHLALEGMEGFLHILAEEGASETLAHFFHGAGGAWVSGILKGLAVPIVFAHAGEYANKAALAFQEGNSEAGTYYTMQAILQVGSMAKFGPLSWACTFLSQMLQVSEGKGMVFEVLTKMRAAGDKLNDKLTTSDLTFTNYNTGWQLLHDTLGGDLKNDIRRSDLEFQSTGYPSRDAALKAIKELRDEAKKLGATGLLGCLQEDYAITQTGSVFTIHKLAGVNVFTAADIGNARELESVGLGDNKKNIVAVVAEDGTWGEVIGEDHEQRKHDGSVAKWRTFEVNAVGKL